jgi:hypothetical protein
MHPTVVSEEKLAVDFVKPVPMCVHRKAGLMDQDTRALVVQLCSYAGAMMEDASVPAVTAGGAEVSELPVVLTDLSLRARQISTLLAAAAVLAGLTPG